MRVALMELAASHSAHFTPLGPFLAAPDQISGRNEEPRQALIKQWRCSAINPCNLIDVRRPATQLQWSLHAVVRRGTQFLVSPKTGGLGAPVNRVDVYLPDQTRYPEHLKQSLDSSRLFNSDPEALSDLPICNLVLQVLSKWSSSIPDFMEIYNRMPFGSRIIVPSISTNVAEIMPRILCCPVVEQYSLTAEALTRMWLMDLPPTVPLDRLRLKSQPSPTISIVSLPPHGETSTFVMKSNVDQPHRLYHELKNLLSIGANEHIIGKPLYLVTSGHSRTGESKVCGIVMQYFAQGSLASIIDRQKPGAAVPVPQRVRWCLQIVDALSHIAKSSMRFYSELRPHNILMTDDLQGIKLIDMEQQANWEAFCAPEIFHIDNLQRLSTHPAVPKAKRAVYTTTLKALGIESVNPGAIYSNPKRGYFDAWEILSGAEQEQATVYSLGVTMWCIFESQNHTNNSVNQEFAYACPTSFPHFDGTPKELRDLIRDCTRSDGNGHAAWDMFEYREGYVFCQVAAQASTPKLMTAHEVIKCAHDSGLRYLASMDTHVGNRLLLQSTECLEGLGHNRISNRRPTLTEVATRLLEFLRWSNCPTIPRLPLPPHGGTAAVK
jgi:serine/threonine protein kinase